MIKSQRKAHFSIWLMLAVALPAGIAGAWIRLPRPVPGRLFQPETTIALPVVLEATEKIGFTVRLRTDKEKTRWQLEWENLSAITVPSALLYQVSSSQSDPDLSMLTGRIGERGIYRFFILSPKDNVGLHFVLYDIIHHRTLNRVDFKL